MEPVSEVMLKSLEIGELAKALALTQGEIQNPPRNREVTVRSDKGSYKFKYATLDAILETVRPPLSKNGLAVVQTLGGANGSLRLTTTLMHSSGQWVASQIPVLTAEGRGGPQAMGSAVTYAKRYALAAIVGVAADEDDDGNDAEGNHIEEAKERRPTAKRGDPKPPANGATTPEGDLLVTEIVAIKTTAELDKWGRDTGTKDAIGKLPQLEQDRIRRAFADRRNQFTVAA